MEGTEWVSILKKKKKKIQQNESPEEARKPGKEKRLASFYYIKALQ